MNALNDSRCLYRSLCVQSAVVTLLALFALACSSPSESPTPDPGADGNGVRVPVQRLV